MAHRVQMKLPGGDFFDYSDYVFVPDPSASGGSQAVAGGGASQSTQNDSLIKTWQLNTPPTCTFFVGGDLEVLDEFPYPKTGTEVQIDSDNYPEFFTGFITNEPEVVPIGGLSGDDGDADPTTRKTLYGYYCNCIGHETLLDMNRIGFIPPFVNMTIGDILAALGDMLVPGRFDWSGVKGFGDVIPVYETTPDQRFKDVEADLLTNQAAKMWFKRYKAHIARFDEGIPGLQPTVSEKDPLYGPYDLAIKPLPNAIVNDATGIGDVEPQVYAREYSLGDGITTDYSLKLPLFGVIGKPVVEDDFTGTAFDLSIWAPFTDLPFPEGGSSDPDGSFIFSGGRLNVVGGLGLGATQLLLQMGIEVKGKIQIDAGEFQFIDASEAIVGGVFIGTNLTLENCKYGFKFSKNQTLDIIGSVADEAPEGTVDGSNSDFFTSQVPIPSSLSITIDGVPQNGDGIDYELSYNNITFTTPPAEGAAVLVNYQYSIGAQTDIQAIVDGVLVGDVVTTKPSMTYSLHLMISTEVGKTTLPPWYSLNSVFGGGSKSAPVTAAFLIEEYSQLAVRDPNKYTIYSVTQESVPAFLFVGELSVVDANFVVNYFQITQPIQGALFTELNSDQAPKARILGYVGQSNADATVLVAQESETLEFFKESRPLLRQRNEFRYRSGGPAVARIIDSGSIAEEALRYGDAGVRSVFLPNISPLPASSEELEWALQAYLDNNTRQQFEGSWTAITPPQKWSGIAGGYEEPMPGRFINVLCPSRTPEVGGFSELVKVVTTTVVAEEDDGTEHFEHEFDFGFVVTKDMQKILERFRRPDPPSVAVLRQVSNVPAFDTTTVGTQFIEDLTGVALVDKDTSNFYFDAGRDLKPGDRIEIRYSDASWGTAGGANLITRVTTRKFSLARKKRDSTFFFKLVRPATVGIPGSPA